MPRTLALLTAVRDALARISIADGYFTDAGATVTLEPAQVPDDTPAVLGVILESVDPSGDPAARALRLRRCTIAIIAKVPTALDDAEARLHELYQDVEDAMDGTQALFPEDVDFPRFAGMSRIPPADGLNWTGAVVRYTSNVRR